MAHSSWNRLDIAFLTGLATLTVACGSSSSTGDTTPELASLSVTPDTATVVVGSSIQLTTRGADATGAAAVLGAVSWASANPAIATVSTSGLVTAAAFGQTSISASSAGRSATALVTISYPKQDSATTQSTGATTVHVGLGTSVTFGAGTLAPGSSVTAQEVPQATASAGTPLGNTVIISIRYAASGDRVPALARTGTPVIPFTLNITAAGTVAATQKLFGFGFGFPRNAFPRLYPESAPAP